ncbi:uncharacterized protein LOC113357717 [Papaver somniferum]|uniref:uncharacterized protein LOC113357717 n=1 Tax=Papaver somniferum TaxID=3469 RepID=UPI000E6FECEC|nr:uncharacterized protein LOC113357717 [Papaver somniferum]
MNCVVKTVRFIKSIYLRVFFVQLMSFTGFFFRVFRFFHKHNLSISIMQVHTIIFMEIASKIANEITVGQRFAAYMVIPMRQEGVPTSCSTQKVLLGQILLASNVSRAKSNCLSMGSSKDQVQGEFNVHTIVPDIVGGAVAGDSVALHCSLYSYLCEYEVTLIFLHMRRIYKDPWLIFTLYVRVCN